MFSLVRRHHRRVPSVFKSYSRSFITTSLSRNECLYMIPPPISKNKLAREIPNHKLNASSVSTIQSSQSQSQSDEIFKIIVNKINSQEFECIPDLLSNFKKQKKVLSNPHLLSIISLLLHVDSINLKGIAYEVFSLYNSEILIDIKGYPGDLLEMLLDVVYYYEDQTNFDLLLSQYLNKSVLKERVLVQALRMYIDNSNVELAKQILYQVVSSPNDISPKILEVYLQKLTSLGANFNNIEFGYHIWTQQQLPVTWVIRDAMLEALAKHEETNKLNNYIVKLSKEDPKILELNEFLGTCNKIPLEEFLSKFNGKIRPLFDSDLSYLYLKVLKSVHNLDLLVKELFPLMIKDTQNDMGLILFLTNKIGMNSNIDRLVEFLDQQVIPLGVFNHKLMKLFFEAHLRNYPDYGADLKRSYDNLLKLDRSRIHFWYLKEGQVNLVRVKDDIKLVKPTQAIVMSRLKQIDKLDFPIGEKVQLVSNFLSRLGLNSNRALFRYLMKMISRPYFKNEQEVKLAQSYLLKLCSNEQDLVNAEFLIAKKQVQLKFSDPNLDPSSRLKIQNDILLKFLTKYSNNLDKKLLADLCSVYINLGEFSISSRILEQVKSLQTLEQVSSFEQGNYDALMVKRLEFKQEILSHNYLKVIELVLGFNKCKDISLRKFFMALILRDVKYLKKYHLKLQRMRENDEGNSMDEVKLKEALVVEKLCLYLTNFIQELYLRYNEEKRIVRERFDVKLKEYKSHCKY